MIVMIMVCTVKTEVVMMTSTNPMLITVLTTGKHKHGANNTKPMPARARLHYSKCEVAR